jgi:hypothetical protein
MYFTPARVAIAIWCQAAKWAKLSADKGNRDARAWPSTMSLELGPGPSRRQDTTQSAREAAKWARQAADYWQRSTVRPSSATILFEGDGLFRQPVDGLALLDHRAGCAPAATVRWIADMHEEARSCRDEDEWNAAKTARRPVAECQSFADRRHTPAARPTSSAIARWQRCR